MRGRNRVIALVSTSVLSLFCQGCMHTSKGGLSGPAIAPNQAMLLATGRTAPDVSYNIMVVSQSQPARGGTHFLQDYPSGVAGPVDFTAPPAPPPSLPANADRFDFGSWSGSGGDTISFTASSTLTQANASLVAARLSPEFESERLVSGEITFSANASMTGLPVDVGITPRATWRSEGGMVSRRVGAEVRIGLGLDERGEQSSARSWYIFAGADGEALCWDVGDKGLYANAVRLRDQVTVGDMQAGVSFQAGAGQLSFSYIRREVEYRDKSVARASEVEDFAGVSFTIRR